MSEKPQNFNSSISTSPRTGQGPTWQKDDDCPTCNMCKRGFTLTRRRHHCRNCGKIFCNSCSRFDHIIKKYGYEAPVRVCRTCKVLLEDEEKHTMAQWDKVADYDLLKFLGEGAFGKVYKVRHKEGGKIYAMKVIEKSKLVSRREHAALKEEKHLLQTLNHPFIVKLYNSFQTQDKLFLIMEFLGGGDCYYIMTKTRIPEPAMKLYAMEIALALDYVHQKGIIYRDLKPENCVLDKEGHMVLTDLGLAKPMDDDRTRQTQVGTPDYWAPEMHKGEIYTRAVDFWALGCLIFEMITARHPFLDCSGTVPGLAVVEQEPNLNVRHVQVTEECKDIVRKFLIKDPTKRLQTLDQIKAHPWFNGVDWDAVYHKKFALPWKPPSSENFDPAFTSQAPALHPSEPGEHFTGFTWQDAGSLASAGLMRAGTPLDDGALLEDDCSRV